MKPTIGFDTAKALAEQNGPALSSEYLEAEHCWIFSHDEPDGWASAVSKTGAFSSVYDLRDNPEQMSEYLALFSSYCSGDKDEARRLLSQFMLRHYPDRVGGSLR